MLAVDEKVVVAIIDAHVVNEFVIWRVQQICDFRLDNVGSCSFGRSTDETRCEDGGGCRDGGEVENFHGGDYYLNKKIWQLWSGSPNAFYDMCFCEHHIVTS